jgi:hypothetical protein
MIRFDNLPPEVMQAMCTPMHQVLPSVPLPNHPGCYSGALFIGSMSAIHEKELLRENRITHLVQVLDIPWLPTDTSAGDKMQYYRIDILDQSTADLRPHLEQACAWIDKALRSGCSVLVHCQQVIPPFLASPFHLLFRPAETDLPFFPRAFLEALQSSSHI